MTNDQILLQLINACVSLGSSGQTNIVTQLSSLCLPDNIWVKAMMVKERMQPDLEIVPNLQSETMQTKPPPFNPERDLPGGVRHDDDLWSDGFHPEHGGQHPEGDNLN